MCSGGGGSGYDDTSLDAGQETSRGGRLVRGTVGGGNEEGVWGGGWRGRSGEMEVNCVQL